MGHGLAAKPQAIRYFPDAALMLDPPAVRTWPSSRDQDVSVLPAAMLVLAAMTDSSCRLKWHDGFGATRRLAYASGDD